MLTEQYKGVIPNLDIGNRGVSIMVGMFPEKYQYGGANILSLNIRSDDELLPGVLNIASALRDAFIHKIPLTLIVEFSSSYPEEPGVLIPLPSKTNFWKIQRVVW